MVCLLPCSQENIEDIQWRVDGKVKVILRGGSIPNQKNIIFDYDALGNRIAKHIVNDQFNLEKSTYYILDATGNVMATYDKEIDYINSKVYLKLKDRYIYGSSRVGVRSTDIDMLALHNPNYSMKSVKYEIGKRTYELSNHLGNVLSVISDKPIPSFEGGNLVGMLADVRVAQDYSPFGVTLSGRDFMLEGAGSSRYGFNSMEKDDEVKGRGNSYDFGARMYDSRLGRWLSIDAYFKEYVPISPYAFAINCPIKLKDSDGNVIVDEKGNPVTVTATKNKDGSYDASFTFAENTSESVKENFRENGGRFITTAIQIQTGRDQIEKAIKSKDNIEIIIDKVNEKHSKDGGLILGETELKQLKSSFQDGKSIVDESQDIRITIYEKAIINHQESKDVKYSQKGLSLDEGIATTGSHEVEHATNSIDRNLLIESTEISDKQHKVAKKVGDNAASEFRNKK